MAQQDTTPTPTRWVSAAALKAMAERGLRAGARFSAGELAQWTAATLTTEQRVHASSRLCHLGLITHKVELVDYQRTDMYTLTREGEAALQAAAAGYQHRSGPKGSRARNPAKPAALVTRLWNLVRVRRNVDSDSAAQTLCTAGDEDFATVQANVRRYLRRWANAGVLTESARRIGAQGHSGGVKRYVLLNDPGPTPPAWRNRALKRGGGA